MGIRLQPLEIDIPDKDPFKNDLLSRKEPAEVLTHLVGSIEGPCVLAVDAEWGAGKTTFLKLWAQHLRNNEFPVVEFNAWETDHSGDPLIALSSELMEGLRKYLDKAERTIEVVKTAAMEVLRYTVPGVVRFAITSILDIGTLAEKEIGNALASHASDRLARYGNAQKSISNFRNVLQKAANGLSKSTGDKPLILMVDELDRCRPTYAVQLLEVAKHLFSVHRVVFVLAINRSELAHSIRALYGQGFNADGYLRRFFDADFRLPAPERKAFIEALLRSMQIDVHLQRTQDQEARRDAHTARELLTAFFGASEISLREIAQAIHRFGLVFASLRADRKCFFTTTTVALILRTLDSNLYYRFVRSKASDLEVVDNVFEHTGGQDLQRTREGRTFEINLIAVFVEQKTGDDDMDPVFHSPLLNKYRNIVKTHDEEDGRQNDPEYAHARKVSLMAEALLTKQLMGSQQVGFLHSVQRLELMSREVIVENRNEAASVIKEITAKVVHDDPGKAEIAVTSVQGDPTASPIDQAVVTTILLQKRGNIEKAIQKWQEIAVSSEGSDRKFAARAWFSVGYLYQEHEKDTLETAINAYNVAIRLKPDYAEAYCKRGDAKNGLRRHEEAIADFDEAIHLKPDYAEAYCKRGGLRRHEEAIADFDKAIRLKPDYADAYYIRSNAKYRIGRHEEAIADLDETIRLEPDPVVAYLYRGAVKNGLGQHEEAIADLDEVIRLKPDLAEAYSERGDAKSGLGRHKEAIADYDEAIRLKPDLAEAYNNRANAKCGLGRYEEAFADYEKVIGLVPDFSAAYYNRGKAKNGLGRHEEAIADFDEAIRLKPDYGSAYNDRGDAKRALGRHEEAIADYDEAICLEPDSVESYNNRGNSKEDLGRHEEAIADFDEAIRLRPDAAQPYYSRGRAKGNIGRHEEAIADYDMAILLKRDFANAYNGRGNVKSDVGRHAEAIADYDMAIRLEPKYTEAYNNRCLAKNCLGRHEEAIADCDEVIRLRPDLSEGYNNRGNTKNRLGRHEEAIADCDEAIRLKPDSAVAYYNRGNAKSGIGQHEEAIVDYDEAIRLKPDYANAYYNRGKANSFLNRMDDARRDFKTAIDLARKAGDEDLVTRAQRALSELPDEQNP